MMDGKSLDLTAERKAQLKQLFPDVFSEAQIDWERLRLSFGEDVFVKDEHYELSWAGKADARREIQKQTTATLLPDPAHSVNFDATENIFIAGENLDVLRILQKSYFGKIKMIYIDPPYNTGNDSFVYPDDYAERREEYELRAGITDERGFLNKQDLWKKNTKENGQFHSVWLSMMYPRLYLARNLLREDGVLFVSIDDNETANLNLLLDEIFGEENFISLLVWQKSKKGDAKLIAKNHEYVVVYAKNIPTLIETGSWRVKKEGVEEVLAHYESLVKQFGQNHPAISEAMRRWYASLPKQDPRKAHAHYRFSDARGLYFADNFAGPDDGRLSRPRYDIIHPITGKPCKKPSTGWRWDEARTKQALAMNPPLIHFGPDETTIPCRKSYLKTIDSEPFSSVFYRDGRAGTLTVEQLVGKGMFDFPKDVNVISGFIKLTTEPDDVILDFFAGSGTTAQAVLELNQEDGGNRRFILVQLPEALDAQSEACKAGYKTIADICTARIKKVIARIEANQQATLDFGGAKPDVGFKAYTLHYSNFKAWRSDVAGKDPLLAQLDLLREPLAEYRGSDAALLTELCLKAGFPLSADVQERTFEGCKIYDIADGAMWIALERVNLPLFQHVAAARPARFVTLGNLFTGENADETMTNAKLQLREAGVELKII